MPIIIQLFGYAKFPMKYISSIEGVKYISTETNQHRVMTEDNTYQKDNLYSPNFDVKNISPEDESDFYFCHLC